MSFIVPFIICLLIVFYILSVVGFIHVAIEKRVEPDPFTIFLCFLPVFNTVFVLCNWMYFTSDNSKTFIGYFKSNLKKLFKNDREQ